jgi:hypothetical protein
MYLKVIEPIINKTQIPKKEKEKKKEKKNQ